VGGFYFILPSRPMQERVCSQSVGRSVPVVGWILCECDNGWGGGEVDLRFEVRGGYGGGGGAIVQMWVRRTQF